MPAPDPMTCDYRPEDVPETAPIGMFHCPKCGIMVLAGLEHPRMCRSCAGLEDGKCTCGFEKIMREELAQQPYNFGEETND